MSILGAEAAALMLDDSAYAPDPVPTKPEIDGDGAWAPFASKKTERESGWLLEQVCKVPALAKLTRREQGVVIDACRRKVFQGGQRLYVQGKGTDYLYLIEDGHVAVAHQARCRVDEHRVICCSLSFTTNCPAPPSWSTSRAMCRACRACLAALACLACLAWHGAIWCSPICWFDRNHFSPGTFATLSSPRGALSHEGLQKPGGDGRG